MADINAHFHRKVKNNVRNDRRHPHLPTITDISHATVALPGYRLRYIQRQA